MLKVVGAVGLGIGRVVGEGVEHPLPDQLFAPASGYALVGVVAAADAQRAIQKQERGSECSGATSWVIASNNG
jgi:hypothetical protein